MGGEKQLVTGSNGFLGTAFVDRLLARGEKGVVCLVRPGSDRSKLDAVLKKHPGADVSVVTGSLGSVDEARKLLDGVGVVHHLAAAVGAPPADMFLGTVVATKHLVEAMLERSPVPKLVLISSFGVYGVAELGRGALIDESTPLEAHPEKRDIYSHSKLRQELLVAEMRRQRPFPLVILRPGVIYGPHGGAMSSRVGIKLPGMFLYLGFKNVLPLSYVDNCAEAICVAAKNAKFDGDVYNVHDDELITCAEYLDRYRREVEPLRVVPLPYPALELVSLAVERYHRWSKGQLPALFTPYKSATTWGGNRFSNAKLHALGWKPIVSTEEGLARTFAALKTRLAKAS
jgi:nucleoside-diphosphate-sugar epimerase